MSYEEEKQDRKIEQLEAEIEKLRSGHCADCCCARSWEALGITEYTGKSIPEEIAHLREWMIKNRDTATELQYQLDEATARIQELEALRSDILGVIRRPKTTSDKGLILYLKELDEYNIRATKRVGDLEDALVEYQRLGKTISEAVVPCLTAHGNCDQCRPKAKAACDAIETIRKGKIGPDAALKKQWDDVLGTKPRSWQITDEREEALHVMGNMKTLIVCPHCKTPIEFADIPPYMAVLRAMLEAGQ